MRLRHLALPAAAGLTLLAIPFAPAAVAAPECDPSLNSCSEVFTYTDATPQTFTVPAGVTNIAVALAGGAGGAGLGTGSAAGGQGGGASAIVPVTPGEVLTLVVGGKGADGSNTGTTGAAGGYGGGGAGTPTSTTGSVGGGGGGSFLFGSNGLLLAVGGGGGGGYSGAQLLYKQSLF